jgi:hypothetical protein
MTTVCTTCLSFTGIRTSHAVETCPVRSTFLCRRCNCRGHTASECGDSWSHWERPAYLEDLIPPDVRARWGITTCTEVALDDRPRSEEERTYEIEVSSNDKKMRDFMKDHAIDTTHKCETNLQRIREWAYQRGFRLRILNS